MIVFETLPFQETCMVRFVVMQEDQLGEDLFWGDPEWCRIAFSTLIDALQAIEVHDNHTEVAA